MRTTLSVKWVWVVMVPTKGDVLGNLDPGKSANAPGNGAAVLIDPRSTNRYSNFHVQFGGSQYESVPSIPPPTTKPRLVLDSPNAVAAAVRGTTGGNEFVTRDPLTLVIPDSSTRP